MKILPRVNNLDPAIIERYKKTAPATVGHFVHDGFMNPAIKPIFPGVKIAGPAFTVKISVNDSTLVHYCTDLIKPGDIIVIDRVGDGMYAPVGEVLALTAKIKGAAGIIVDGPVTDVVEIKEIGIPVFATGLSAVTTKLLGIYGEINTAIQCGGVVVNPGDLIFADDNGVMVIKPEDAEKLLLLAEDSDKNEIPLKEKVINGGSLPELTGASKLVTADIPSLITQIKRK